MTPFAPFSDLGRVTAAHRFARAIYLALAGGGNQHFILRPSRMLSPGKDRGRYKQQGTRVRFHCPLQIGIGRDGGAG